MADIWQWVDKDKTLKSLSDKTPKKITGTRFAAILGKNPYSSSFACWADMLHVWEEPFSETKYTYAGKVIEPKQAEFMVNTYGMSNLKTPTDIFGEGYFGKTRGNFFTHDVFGGMWDFILVDEETGSPNAVLEMKTTKNKAAWKKGPPEYYSLQAALYAYLLNVQTVYVVATYLEDDDYEDPEAFVPTLDNTEVFSFVLNDRYPNFEGEYIIPATNWWNEHIVNNVSPKITSKDLTIVTQLIQDASTNIVDIPDQTLYNILNDILQVLHSIDNKLNVKDKSRVLNE